MARNAADAARLARPKGENFSVSLRMFHGQVLVKNRTGWKRLTREFNPSVSFINISILKNFHEMSRLAPSRPVKPTHSPPFLPVLLVRSFLALLNDTGGKAQIVSLARFSALPRPRWSSSFCKCLLMFPPLRPILKKDLTQLKK
jgi:hypothetical protein